MEARRSKVTGGKAAVSGVKSARFRRRFTGSHSLAINLVHTGSTPSGYSEGWKPNFCMTCFEVPMNFRQRNSHSTISCCCSMLPSSEALGVGFGVEREDVGITFGKKDDAAQEEEGPLAGSKFHDIPSACHLR